MINSITFKWRYNVEILAGMDMAFVAALLVFEELAHMTRVCGAGGHGEAWLVGHGWSEE